MKSLKNRLWILPGILLLPAILMARSEIYTDYINGKWYSCDSWVVNAAGDTVFMKKYNGNFKVWRKFDENHREVYVKMNDGTECYTEYNEAGKPTSETCSHGGNNIYTYDNKNRLIRYESTGKYTKTIVYEYDGNSDRVIHTINSLGDSWTEYENGKKARVLHSNGQEEGFYPDGKRKYFKAEDGGVLYYDHNGEVNGMMTPDGEMRNYNNQYDPTGKFIIYDARHKIWFKYFSRKDTTYKCEDR